MKDIQKCLDKVRSNSQKFDDNKIEGYSENDEKYFQENKLIDKEQQQIERKGTLKAEASPYVELMTLSANGLSNKGINCKQTSTSFSSFKTFAKKFGSKEDLIVVQQEDSMNCPSPKSKLVKKLSKLVNLSHSLPILEESHLKQENIKNDSHQEYSVSEILLIYKSYLKSHLLISTQQQANF